MSSPRSTTSRRPKRRMSPTLFAAFPSGRPTCGRLSAASIGQRGEVDRPHTLDVIAGEADAMFPARSASGPRRSERVETEWRREQRGVGAFHAALSRDQFESNRP